MMRSRPVLHFNWPPTIPLVMAGFSAHDFGKATNAAIATRLHLSFSLYYSMVFSCFGGFVGGHVELVKASHAIIQSYWWRPLLALKELVGPVPFTYPHRGRWRFGCRCVHAVECIPNHALSAFGISSLNHETNGQRRCVAFLRLQVPKSKGTITRVIGILKTILSTAPCLSVLGTLFCLWFGSLVKRTTRWSAVELQPAPLHSSGG